MTSITQKFWVFPDLLAGVTHFHQTRPSSFFKRVLPAIFSNRILWSLYDLACKGNQLLSEELLEVEKRVQLAKRLYSAHASKLLLDKGFCSLLKAYSREIEKSKRLMVEVGLPGLCSYCATKIPGGGCCGSHIATWYDPLVLLLNLFMDVEIPDKSYYKDSCRFLGKEGCALKARYHFCVNYLCKRIHEHLDEEKVSWLKAQSGAELFLAWKLELYLMDFFSKEGLIFSNFDIPS